MRSVNKQVRHAVGSALGVALFVALAAAMIVLFFDELSPKHKEALTLWAVALNALSTFLLVVLTIWPTAIKR